jgi:DHA1 family bicyclomycin/chloramphenicol resistance-like MFS transporter
MAADTPPPPPERHAHLPLLLVLGALTAFGPMSIDMYLASLPTLERELHASASGGQATVAAFFAGLSIGQLFYGPLSDRIGRRPPVLAGIALFLVATVGCALATSLAGLVAFRALEALGACAGMVVARAVVRDRFEPRESARIFSLLMLIMGVAPILAPLLGGFILEWSGWRAIFWALFAFGAVTGVAVFLKLPETRSAATAARALSESPLAAYLALLRNRGAVTYTLAGAFVSSAMFTYIAASPTVVIEHFGVPATAFGWVFGANAVGIIGASQLNRLLLRRWSPDTVLRASTAMGFLAALVLLATSLSGFGGLWGVLVPLFFAVAGHGLGAPNATASALAFDPQRAGSLSALVGCAQFGIGALAAAAAGAMGDGSPAPMAAVIAACTLAAAVSARLAPRRLEAGA